jgi:hypothetical protein
LKEIDLSYLHEVDYAGANIIKCRHYSHYKCINNYLVANEADPRKRDLRKIIGLDLETFQCPLCKQIANVLFPSNSLEKYEENKLYQKDFNKNSLIDFYSTFFSVLNKQ